MVSSRRSTGARSQGAAGWLAFLALLWGAAALPTPVRAQSAGPEVGRLAGLSRADTAVAISRYQYPEGAEEVYLTRGDVLADAVAAGSLTGGPVLLVPRCGVLPAAVASEITRLDPERVVVLGGPAAVCDALVARTGRPSTRLEGASRIDTAVAIAQHQYADGAEEVYLTRSDVLADAVAAGSLTRGPVLLAPSCGALPETVVAEITRLDPQRVVALGGPAALCDDVLAHTGRPVTRLAGASRIDTAVAIARHEFPEGAQEVYLTRSDESADAVAAGSLTGGPVLLTRPCSAVTPVLRSEIARLGPSRIVALGGASAVCTAVLEQASGRNLEECLGTRATELGPATRAAPVVTGTLVGDRNYVVTRGLVPPVLGELELVDGTVERAVRLPTGQGAWASTADDDGDLYVGTYAPADLYHVDTQRMTARRVASFPDASTVASLATTPDGTVLAGTLPNGALYEYDPDRERLTSHGQPADGEYAVRSIAVTEDTVYAGLGSHAHLIAMDRDGGDERDILPPELEGESFVYTLRASEDWLVAGTEPSGRVVVMPIDDPGAYRVLPGLGERTVDAIAIDGADVYFTGRTTGAVYHHDAVSDATRRLAVPIPREETRSLFVHGRTLIGTGGSGTVWRLGLDTGAVQVIDLVTAGLPAGAEPVQSLSAFDGTVVAGGHWGLQIHAGAGHAAARVRVPGEAKAMGAAGDRLFAALYPSAELWAHAAGSAAPTRLAAIGSRQARPRDLHVDPVSGLVAVASQSDYGMPGGALAIYDPRSGQLQVHRDVVAGQSSRSVAGAGAVVYVGTEVTGGSGAPPADGSARIVAWDVAAGAPRWDVAPVEGADAIVEVVTLDGIVHGLTNEGVLFTLDPATREVTRTLKLRSGRAMAVQGRSLVVTTVRGLHRIDPVTRNDVLLGTGPDYRLVAAAPACTLYAVRGTTLVEIEG